MLFLYAIFSKDEDEDFKYEAYEMQKKRVAESTKNDRLNAIELRTFRHWAGTMIAQRTNGNVLIVMKLLGHKRVESSMKYINIYMLSFQNKDYDVLAATSVDEIKPAIAAGYDYVCEKSGITFFRRQKCFSTSPTPIIKREADCVILK